MERAIDLIGRRKDKIVYWKGEPVTEEDYPEIIASLLAERESTSKRFDKLVELLDNRDRAHRNNKLCRFFDWLRF